MAGVCLTTGVQGCPCSSTALGEQHAQALIPERNPWWGWRPAHSKEQGCTGATPLSYCGFPASHPFSPPIRSVLPVWADFQESNAHSVHFGKMKSVMLQLLKIWLVITSISSCFLSRHKDTMEVSK